ncbi:hypothetical protein BBD42_05155 [Paenibacillus sp. BIHB 4019]|uniref:ABC transporter domain-containing protein n=1 Tax=Paenibacillus sp. BIHB 4019 TaxID=1870819 RepID=A0A1B2DS92_9BACL|nr:hypothetical protein BBD42_05155 [Paenibacillus sp. BIHB 4019]
MEYERASFVYPGHSPSGESGFDLQIMDGETVLLLGPSGSGKSTLALCLSGLIPHAIAGELSGHIRINGVDTQLTEPGQLAETVGTVFQDPEAQAIMMTVEDEVAFGLENLGVAPEEMEERITEALRQTGLSTKRLMEIDNLSGGQKQRLALASVLAMKPSILVLDEPTSNLDPVGTDDIFQILRELKATRRHTILIIEHKLDELVDIVDRVVVIDDHGQLVCSAAPELVFYDWAEELNRLGIWMPKAVELAKCWQGSLSLLNSRPLTTEQLEKAVLATIKRGLAKPNDFTGHPLFFNGNNTAEGQPAAISQNNREQQLLLEIRPIQSPSLRATCLKPLELQVHKGEFWAIVGENGAGKTTLARHLMGLSPVRAGTVFLDGRDCTSYSARELASKIGYVFQNPEHQFVTERVQDEVAFGLLELGMTSLGIAVVVEQLLSRFGLSKYADIHPFRLSHGQKRRLSVAVMLAASQELLILDEPTFGQDRRYAAELMEMLKELQRSGRTILMITHDMSLVAEYAEFAAVLSQGSIHYSGPVMELFSNKDTLAPFGLKLPPAVVLEQRLAKQIGGPPICNKEPI